MNYFAFVAALLLSYNCVAQGRASYDCPANISKKMRPPGNSYISVEAGGVMPLIYKDASKSKDGLYKPDTRPRVYIAAFAYKPLTYWLEVYGGLQVLDIQYGLESNFTQSGSDVYEMLYNNDIQVRIPIGFNFNITRSTQLGIAPAFVYSNYVEQWQRFGTRGSGSTSSSGTTVRSGQTEFIHGDYGGSIRLGGDLRIIQTIFKGLRLNAQFSIDSKPLSPLTASTRVLHEDGSRKTYTQTVQPTMMYACLGLSYRFF